MRGVPDLDFRVNAIMWFHVVVFHWTELARVSQHKKYLGRAFASRGLACASRMASIVRACASNVKCAA